MNGSLRVVTSTCRPAELSRATRRDANRTTGAEKCDCLIEVDLGRDPSSTLVGSRHAAEMAEAIADRVAGVEAAVRGGLCLVSAGPEDWTEKCEEILDCLDPDVTVWVAVPGPLFGRSVSRLIDLAERVDLEVEAAADDPDVLELSVIETVSHGFAAVGTPDRPRDDSRKPERAGRIRRIGRRIGQLLASGRSEGGQATLLAVGACFVAIVMAVILLSVAGAVTGKGRAQRAADLSALSAARSMRDDLPRLLAPPTLPNGVPNPAHMPKPVYLARAAATARRIAGSNGASPISVSIGFPDAASFAPLRARVTVPVRVDGRVGPASEPVRAEARVGIATAGSGGFALATGGGYSGPLVLRQGHGMRPDVAAAFDLMAAAATSSGVSLVINSGFRSDAEQARLFSANPDPRWVAPPGRSLHRCATELDIGPPSAYAWLAANAGRFGFTKRYSWEPWHFGFTAGPAPCSSAGERTGSGRSTPESARGHSGFLPSWVPGRYRPAIARASLATGVPAVLLAAQLRAESNFDPGVVSSAGAQGIAQFMPATAASYGLRDPFDPYASIAAQARMMAELLKEFGSPALALAAYNAGPGAVGSCRCIPPYPETQTYVARILALIGDLGSLGPPGMEVELIG